MELERDAGGGKVCALIEKATNTTAPEVDPRLLKSIKSLARDSESELQSAAQTLMSLMKRDHSQVRYLALLIIDELFMRSKLFRTLLVDNFDQLLTLSVGFRRNSPLPAPVAVASVLRSKAIEFLEKWNASFGIHYRQLRLGFDYLKNTLRLQFPNLQANAARIQQGTREREMRSKEIVMNKFQLLKGNLPSIKAEIQSTIDEIGECLDIVSTRDEDICLDPMGDREFEEFKSSELRQIRLDSLKEGEKVHENSDNKVVFDTLRELYKLVVTKHLISVQEWISILVRVDVTSADSRFRDSTLKEFIDIRNRLLSVKKRCEESGCALHNRANNEEEDIWEEGKIEPIYGGGLAAPPKQTEDTTAATISEEVNARTSECSIDKSNGKKMLDCDSGGSDSSTLRSQLLAEAPVMQWGSFLDSWGSNREILANQRGLELEGHWGRVDLDAVIPAEKIAELNVQMSIYKEEPVEIQPCRAPLRNGGLCQRRDVKVCPFHGPIVSRDNEGKPIDENPLMEDVTVDMGSSLVEKLAKQAVNNVRDRDKEEATKRENDKQSLKRAKLAKVREHNDAVLREAALGLTSRSDVVGEDGDLLGGDRSSAKSKKQTLASMLHKKVTAKDRLSQRLLNTRAKEATVRRLMLGEDSKYREAFPNQW